MALRAAHALDLGVQAGFLGPYVSFEPTRPPHEQQQTHLVVYEKEESALLAHDFKYGDAAFALLHRNLLALEKILPARYPDVAEQEQPIVQRLPSGPQRGFLSASSSGTRRRTIPTPPWRRRVQAASRRCPRLPSRCLLHWGAKQPPSYPPTTMPPPRLRRYKLTPASSLVSTTSVTYCPKAKRKQ